SQNTIDKCNGEVATTANSVFQGNHWEVFQRRFSVIEVQGCGCCVRGNPEPSALRSSLSMPQRLTSGKPPDRRPPSSPPPAIFSTGLQAEPAPSQCLSC